MPITGKEYHDVTSYDRHRMKNHDVDWQNQPEIQKVYPGMDYRYLPRPETIPRVPVHEAMAPLPPETPHRPVTADRLSVILALAYGITGKMIAGKKKDYYFRGVPSAGGLYPTEIYLAAGTVGGLEAGLYYYDVAGLGLCNIRSGNIITAADRCVTDKPEGPLPDLSFFLTGVIFRSAWKYKERAYRYVLNDTGHVLENLLLTLRACGIRATVHYDIDTDAANSFLGCDPLRETCFACVRIVGSGAAIENSAPLSPLPRTVTGAGKTCKKEDFFGEIQQILAATKLPSPSAPSSPMNDCLGIIPGKWQPVLSDPSNELMDFPTTVVRRRSRRNFVPAQLAEASFMGIMALLSARAQNVFPSLPASGNCISAGLLLQNTSGISPGYYLCDFPKNRFGLIKEGRFNAAMAAACLDQHWLQNAALHFCFMADLEQLDKTLGARGYQYAMLEAGRLGQAVYLAATTHGMGCCGIGSHYDNETRTQLELNSNSALLYLVAVGPVKDERG